MIETVTHPDGSSVMLGTGRELLDRYIADRETVLGESVPHDLHTLLGCQSPQHDDQDDQSRMILPDRDRFAMVEEDAVQSVFCEKCGLEYRDSLLKRGGKHQA